MGFKLGAMSRVQPELRKRWTDDGAAIKHLEERGYILQRDGSWDWTNPKKITPTEQDWSAFDYLFMEWDFGYLND